MAAIRDLICTTWTVGCGWFSTRLVLAGFYLEPGLPRYAYERKKLKKLSMILKMKNYYKLLALFVVLISHPVLAQNQEVEMADIMRSNGKIYVVVAFILVIFVGLVVYLVSMDRKITQLENKLTSKKS